MMGMHQKILTFFDSEIIYILKLENVRDFIKNLTAFLYKLSFA
jgi:hypothetical protein